MTVASIGFNGFPRRMEDKAEWLINREEKYSRVIHAEMNAILNAREPLAGYVCYTWPTWSCQRCATHLIQAGISQFVGVEDTELDLYKRTAVDHNRAIEFFADAGVKVLLYTPEDLA
jgi:dCMP deaminase